jgi:hypothetical protein
VDSSKEASYRRARHLHFAQGGVIIPAAPGHFGAFVQDMDWDSVVAKETLDAQGVATEAWIHPMSHTEEATRHMTVPLVPVIAWEISRATPETLEMYPDGRIRDEYIPRPIFAHGIDTEGDYTVGTDQEEIRASAIRRARRAIISEFQRDGVKLSHAEKVEAA